MDKDREATVFFECGAKNEILKVSEPERCEYHFFFRYFFDFYFFFS